MGNDEGYGGGFDDDGFDDELDDEDPPEKKKKIATSTKIVLVVAGWLLLTLFLIGEFSKDQTPTRDTVSAQLDTVDGDDADEEDEELFVDEEQALEAFDTDGDGVLSESERAAAVEAYEAAVAAGEIAIGEPWNGVTGTPAVATEEGRAESAAPSDGPTSGGTSGGSDAGSGSGTGTGGGSATGSPTTTAAGGSSGGGGSTTTAKAPTSGGSTTTTAKATTTTSPTTAPPPPPPGGSQPGPDQTIVITKASSDYVYTPRNFTVSPGTRVRMTNSSNTIHTWQIEDGLPESINKGVTTDYRTITSTVNYRCTIVAHELSGRITVSG